MRGECGGYWRRSETAGGSEILIKSRQTLPRIKRLRVAQVVPKPRIENEAELEAALGALREAVTEALDSADAVEIE